MMMRLQLQHIYEYLMTVELLVRCLSFGQGVTVAQSFDEGQLLALDPQEGLVLKIVSIKLYHLFLQHRLKRHFMSHPIL